MPARLARNPVGSASGWLYVTTTAHSTHTERGTPQRNTICAAAKELVTEVGFEKLSVSAITKQAGITRPGFYFYFDSKDDVLAAVLQDCLAESHDVSKLLPSRRDGETAEAFVARIVAAVATVMALQDPVVAACHAIRAVGGPIRAAFDRISDAVAAVIAPLIEGEVHAGVARPVDADIPGMVRTLTATTQLIVVGDRAFVASDDDGSRATAAIQRLWLAAFWRDSLTGKV